MLTLSPTEIDKLVQDFCEEKMWLKNMICRSLTENFPESCARLNQCPLFKFKLYLMGKARETMPEDHESCPHCGGFMHSTTAYGDGYNMQCVTCAERWTDKYGNPIDFETEAEARAAWKKQAEAKKDGN